MLNDSWSKEVPAAFNAVNITSFALPADKTELKKLTQIKRSLVDFREDETPSVSLKNRYNPFKEDFIKRYYG
jgi:hypothetical protein